MAARLKVFVTSDGLTDYIVATTSRPKALAAWGSHQDLFATGLAHETDDPELTAAAKASPGAVLRRPAGSRAALAKLKPARKAAPKGRPTKAQLKKVAELETRLVAADKAYAADLAELDRRRQARDAAHAKDRARLEAALKAARGALG